MYCNRWVNRERQNNTVDIDRVAQLSLADTAKKVKSVYSFSWKTQFRAIRSVTCHTESHGASCYPT